MLTSECGRARLLFGRVGWLAGLLAGLAPMAYAANPPTITPGIPGEGAMHPLPDAAYQPPKDATYKVVFALTRSADSPQEVNPSLIRVARTINLYVSAGVPISHLKFVAVASGPATGAMLDDAHYQAKFGVVNPNTGLIRKLREAGVDVAVCGQAVLENNFETAWISHDVTIALSALTTVTMLQHQGYALMPL